MGLPMDFQKMIGEYLSFKIVKLPVLNDNNGNCSVIMCSYHTKVEVGIYVAAVHCFIDTKIVSMSKLQLWFFMG